MGDESLKFIGYAHPGAVIGADKRDWHIREGRRGGMVHVLEQELAPVEHERPFDTACMPLQGFLYRFRLKPCAHGKIPSV
jgi:hypothetical protein